MWALTYTDAANHSVPERSTLGPSSTRHPNRSEWVWHFLPHGKEVPVTKPGASSDPLYRLLREDDVANFNQQRAGAACDFRGCSFRGADLRGLDASAIDFRDAYFRDADLRGVDLRQARLEGASLASAKVSGAFFPDEIAPEELRLSIEFGTRLRANKRAPG